jgi:hypothetical protein
LPFLCPHPNPSNPPQSPPTRRFSQAQQAESPAVVRKIQEPRQDIDGIVLGYGEQVLLKTRRHQWAWVRRIGIAVLLMGMACVGAFASFSISIVLSLFVLGLGGIIGFVASGYFYLEWRNDLFVVTNRRVISIERVIPTFSVSINEVPLTNIQQVNAQSYRQVICLRGFLIMVMLNLKMLLTQGIWSWMRSPTPIVFNKQSLRFKRLFASKFKRRNEEQSAKR